MRKTAERAIRERLIWRGALPADLRKDESTDLLSLVLEAVEAYAFDPERLLWESVTARDVVQTWNLARFVEVRVA